MNNKFTEEMLENLRESVKNEMGEKRYNHTLEVEKMAVRLGEIYAPDKIPTLRAAALLHDVTKERSAEEHIAICERAGLSVSVAERKSPKMFHSKTAALIIPEKYPEFAVPELVQAIKYHTTGKADMNLIEKIIYLADYIDDTRTFPACVQLRSFFFDAEPQKMGEAERLKHLYQTLLLSFDLTLKDLLEEGAPIAEDSFLARNHLILLLSK